MYLLKAKRLLKDSLFADTVGMNKAGNIVVRKGYFYTHGYDEEKLAAAVSAFLVRNKIAAKIISKGNVWKAFRGSATVANSSHWFVEICVEGEASGN